MTLQCATLPGCKSQTVVTPHPPTPLLGLWLQPAVRLEMLKLTPMLVEATRSTRDVSKQVGSSAHESLLQPPL